VRFLAALHQSTGTDAWLAALALEKDATLASADTGFSRFDGLRWINPLAVKH
jgi:predicted nucleic acid-binding protein